MTTYPLTPRENFPYLASCDPLDPTQRLLDSATTIPDSACESCGKPAILHHGRPEPTCDCAMQGGDR